jgi:hypothetical protein
MQVGVGLDGRAYSLDCLADKRRFERMTDKQTFGRGGAHRGAADAGQGDAGFDDRARGHGQRGRGGGEREIAAAARDLGKTPAGLRRQFRQRDLGDNLARVEVDGESVEEKVACRRDACGGDRPM